MISPDNNSPEGNSLTTHVKDRVAPPFLPNPSQPDSRPSSPTVTLPRVIGAGVAAALTAQIAQAEQTREKLHSGDPRNVFEPGRHCKRQEEFDEVNKEFLQGNPDAHTWIDSSLRERLATVSPSVLTIDGLAPLTNGNSADKEWTAMTWQVSPARPSKVGQSDLYLIAGDHHFKDIATQIASSAGPSDQTLVQQMVTVEDNKISQIDLDKFGLASTVAGILLTASTLPLIRKHDATATRRRVLQGMVGVATLAATTGVSRIIEGSAFPLAADLSPEKQKETFQKIVAYTDPIPRDVWLDGRTALLIAKNEDAMKYLRGARRITDTAKSAIVMGYGHDSKSYLFMHDKKARDQAIFRYAKQILDTTHHFLDADGISQKLSEKQRRDLDRQILNYFASEDIIHVTDPGIAPGANVPKYAEDNVKQVTTIYSGQVMDAVQSLLSSTSTIDTDGGSSEIGAPPIAEGGVAKPHA